MHRVLERQIKRFLGASLDSAGLSPQLVALLQAVSETYDHADEDRQLLSHSLDLSSKEFVDINKRLRSENDIVEQKVRDRTRELLNEQAKLSVIAAYMPTGAILVNETGQPIFVNEAAAAVLGTNVTEKMVDALAERFPSVSVRPLLEGALAGTSASVSEVEAAGKIFSMSFAPITGEGRVVGALVWINDVTAQSMLDRAKNQFIAIASHEMRTPLAIIRGNAELMLDEDEVKSAPRVADETRSILKSAIRLLGIVNDFLDLQNLESGHIALKPEKIDVAQVIQDTIADLAPLAQEKHLTLSFDAAHAPSIPTIVLDKSRLQQICINVISNAIHYTETGGVTVSLEKTDRGLKVLFRDTGIGIDAEDQTRIFKKFSTARKFLKTKEYGSGLGLYISSILAQAMKCDLKLDESTVGKGSVFALTIPFAPESAAPVVQ